MKRGEDLFRSGELEGAKKSFEDALTGSPDDRETLNNLGVVAFRQKEAGQAISYFARALKLDPNYFEAKVNLGDCLMSSGDYRGAIPWLKGALELRPDDVGALNALANCLIQTGDFTGAQEIYERSHHLNGHQASVEEILSTLERLKAFGAQRRTTP